METRDSTEVCQDQLTSNKVLNHNICELKTNIDAQTIALNMVKRDVSTMKEDICELKCDVSIVKQDVRTVEQDVSELQSNVSMVKEDIRELKSNLSAMMTAENQELLIMNKTLGPLESLVEDRDELRLALTTLMTAQTQCQFEMSKFQTSLNRIKQKTDPIYADCADALAQGMTKSDIYKISPEGGPPFLVFCEQEYSGGGWTVFQKREMNGTDFYRVWLEYKNGFGELQGDHWLGNDYLHRLTKNQTQEMTVRLQYPGGPIKSARYASFAIESEENKYQLKISGFDGDTPPGDSMIAHHNLNNAYFSTKDRDHDVSNIHCAQLVHSAWWFRRCAYSNLNGGWHQSGSKVVYWYTWERHRPLLTTTMLLRVTPHT